MNEPTVYAVLLEKEAPHCWRRMADAASYHLPSQSRRRAKVIGPNQTHTILYPVPTQASSRLTSPVFTSWTRLRLQYSLSSPPFQRKPYHYRSPRACSGRCLYRRSSEHSSLDLLCPADTLEGRLEEKPGAIGLPSQKLVDPHTEVDRQIHEAKKADDHDDGALRYTQRLPTLPLTGEPDSVGSARTYHLCRDVDWPLRLSDWRCSLLEPEAGLSLTTRLYIRTLGLPSGVVP